MSGEPESLSEPEEDRPERIDPPASELPDGSSGAVTCDADEPPTFICAAGSID